VGRTVSPIGAKVTGELEQGLGYDSGIGWTAPGTFDLKLEVFSSVKISKKEWKIDWWSHTWHIGSWDFLKASGSTLDEVPDYKPQIVSTSSWFDDFWGTKGQLA
jgi:hypothetical protein